MKTNYYYSLVAVLFFMAFTKANAQENCQDWYWGINYTFLQPLDNLQENGFGRTHGMSMEGLYNLSDGLKDEVHIGLRLNTLLGEAERDDITLAIPENATAISRVFNSMFELKGVARWILAPNRKFSPYVEGHLGGRFVFGHETLRSAPFDRQFDLESNFYASTSAAFVYGLGAGALIQIAPNVDIDLSVNYDRGTRHQFIDMNSYQLEDNVISYDLTRSTIDDLTIHIGFRFLIDTCADKTSIEREKKPKTSPSTRSKRTSPQRKKTRKTVKS